MRLSSEANESGSLSEKKCHPERSRRTCGCMFSPHSFHNCSQPKQMKVSSKQMERVRAGRVCLMTVSHYSESVILSEVEGPAVASSLPTPNTTTVILSEAERPAVASSLPPQHNHCHPERMRVSSKQMKCHPERSRRTCVCKFSPHSSTTAAIQSEKLSPTPKSKSCGSPGMRLISNTPPRNTPASR
jgi:hypothetical protein